FDRSRHAELKRASIGIVCLEFVAPIERPAHVPSVNLYPDYSSLTRLDDFVVVKVFCFASRRGGLHEKARSDELIAIRGSEKRNLCGSLFRHLKRRGAGVCDWERLVDLLAGKHIAKLVREPADFDMRSARALFGDSILVDGGPLHALL